MNRGEATEPIETGRAARMDGGGSNPTHISGGASSLHQSTRTGSDQDFADETNQHYRRLRHRIASVVGSPIAEGWTDSDWHAYHSAVAEVRDRTDFELEWEREKAAYRLAFTDTDAETLALMHVREVPWAVALSVEQHHRLSALRSGTVTPIAHSRAYEAIAELLRQIDDEITLADVLERETRFQVRHGKSESHSGCPACNDGTDRLILWPGLPSWGFCRQCGWKPSVVGLAGFLWGLDARSAEGLREIALRLARGYLHIDSEAA